MIGKKVNSKSQGINPSVLGVDSKSGGDEEKKMNAFP
jgi:hypothetical protein